MPEKELTAENLEQLINSCKDGEQSSFNRIYNLFASKMFVVCLRYSKTREEAEETLQEGFMKVFEHLHQFKSTGSFEGWIRKIMVNTALQKFRTKKSNLHAVIDIDTVNIESYASEDILSRISSKELMEMVQKLPAGYRLVFNLYVFEGMKHREIAEALNISEGTSKSNLFDARNILQKAIAKSLQAPKTMNAYG